MNRRIQTLACICAALIFAACGAKHGGHAHEHAQEHHSHTEEHHAHEGHSHDEHSHEEHSHTHDAHSHDEHSHDEHGHAHDAHSHGEGISFTKQQAIAAGLKVETVVKAPFSGVIKTAGHIQAPKGGETVVVATSAGVLFYADPSITEGVAVSTGKALAGISAKKLQDGDPLLKAKLAYETALAEYERAQRLVDDKIVSAKEYEQIRLRYETAKTTYE